MPSDTPSTVSELAKATSRDPESPELNLNIGRTHTLMLSPIHFVGLRKETPLRRPGARQLVAIIRGGAEGLRRFVYAGTENLDLVRMRALDADAINLDDWNAE